MWSWHILAKSELSVCMEIGCPSEYPHIRFPDLLHEIRWNVVLGSTLSICSVELISISVRSLIYIKLGSWFLFHFFFKVDHCKGKWLVVIGRKYSVLCLWRISPSGTWATSLLRFLDRTQLDTHTHPVGLSRTTDQLIAETVTYATTTKKETNINATIGIQTRDSSNQAAEDLCLRPPGYREQLFF